MTGGSAGTAPGESGAMASASVSPPVAAQPAAGPAAPRPGIAVQTTGLSKRYGQVLALERLDLVVPDRSVFGLLGPNGAGKTTTLRILAGLVRPSGGSASVAGVRLDTSGRLPALDLQRRIGVLDQQPRYYPWQTGAELLTLAGRLHGLAGRELRARVDELLELVGLTSAAKRRVGGYSGGMRQRIGIAQALVSRPPVLILDEPVSSLDPEGRRDLLTLIGTLRDQSTVLFSTHVLNDVERVCDRVAILNLGRLLVEAPLAELLARYARPVYQLEPEPGQEAAVATLVDRLHHVPWVTEVGRQQDVLRIPVSDVTAAARELLPLVTESGLQLSSFERQRPDLEEVFLRIVAEDRRPSGPVAGDPAQPRGSTSEPPA